VAQTSKNKGPQSFSQELTSSPQTRQGQACIDSTSRNQAPILENTEDSDIEDIEDDEDETGRDF
jgi:hypothetical protein